MVGVTFDMDDALFYVFSRIALAVQDQATADGAVRAGVTGFFRVRQLEVTHLLGEGRRRGHAQRRQARASKANCGDLEELPTVEVHRALLIRWWTRGTWPAPLGSHGGGFDGRQQVRLVKNPKRAMTWVRGDAVAAWIVIA